MHKFCVVAASGKRLVPRALISSGFWIAASPIANPHAYKPRVGNLEPIEAVAEDKIPFSGV